MDEQQGRPLTSLSHVQFYIANVDFIHVSNPNQNEVNVKLDKTSLFTR
jgi:hypothetical protein